MSTVSKNGSERRLGHRVNQRERGTKEEVKGNRSPPARCCFTMAAVCFAVAYVWAMTQHKSQSTKGAC
jgi:hypothetical protein